MIITSKQFISSIWLVIALIVATLLAIALPATVHAQTLASRSQASQAVVTEGFASWYNMGLHGAKTASGERYDHKAMTAAHPSLPFDTMVKVTNLENNQFVVVRINDRMKSGAKHIIDLSGAAAHKIGLFESGTASVSLLLMDSQELATIAVNDPGSTSGNKPEVQVMGPPVLSSGVSSGAKPATPVQPVSATSKKENVVQQVSSKDGAYTLQIGSFSTHARAKILADQYEEAWIARIDVNGEVSFRVYFSRFDQEKPARIAQNDLWTKGQDSFLRKVAS